MDTDRRGRDRRALADGSIVLSGLIHHGNLLVFIRAIRGSIIFALSSVGTLLKTEKKPIRGFFQEGINDLDNDHGNWPLGNMAMESALKFKGYDHRYV